MDRPLEVLVSQGLADLLSVSQRLDSTSVPRRAGRNFWIGLRAFGYIWNQAEQSAAGAAAATGCGRSRRGVCPLAGQRRGEIRSHLERRGRTRLRDGFAGRAGDKWTPGLSVPFDPRASKMAEILKIKVVMVNGKHLERFEQFLNNKEFIGTTIQ